MKIKKTILLNINVNNYYTCKLMVIGKCILLVFMGYLLFHKGVEIHLLKSGDDVIFLSFFNYIHSHSISALIEVLHNRYFFWTGRILIEAILILTIGYSFFLKLIVPLSLLLLSISISRIACGYITLFYSFLVLLFLLLIPSPLNNEAAWWVTGFYNYLFPTSCMFYAISIISNSNQNIVEFIFSILAVFVFSYTEQTGICFLLIVFYYFLFLKSTRQKKYYLLYCLCLINYTLLLAAPGNQVRYITAAWGWFPEYIYYSVPFKLYYGLIKLHQALILDWNIPLIIFLLLQICLYLRQGIKTITGYISLFVVSFFIVCSLYHWLRSSLAFWGVDLSVLNALLIGSHQTSLISSYISLLFVLNTLVSVIILILSSIIDKQRSCLMVIIFCVGILSIVLVGFSPTVFLSGLRVFYLNEICFILLLMLSIHYLFDLINEK